LNPGIHRILDANCNRTREALRVIEEYARFVLNDEALCESLKTLRHDFTVATASLAGVSIFHRDTPGDVGTGISTPQERTRAGLADVVTASCKRLGEALRVIEEYLKVDQPDTATLIEQIRYRFYTIEGLLAGRLRPATRFADVRLYILITESSCKSDWLTSARDAIAGGADCIQLREKNLDSGELLVRARQLATLCAGNGVVFIVNDRPDIAMLCNADGVHVGQTDLSILETRKLVGPEKIIGVSTHSIEQARQAVHDGADYIGVGPIYLSPTKPRDHIPGLAFARAVHDEITCPAIAIAGITLANLPAVLETGLRAVAVTSAILECDDVRGAARLFKTQLTPDARA